MNFFKKFGRKTTVSVLDDTKSDDIRSQLDKRIRRRSAGLRRSDGLSSHENYHETETTLFTVNIFQLL